MKKHLIRCGIIHAMTLVTAMCVSLSGWSRQVSEADAAIVARSFFADNHRYRTVSPSVVKDVKLVYKPVAKRFGAASPAEVDYYVFANGVDNAFVIVSGDDELKPVVGYSLNGTFDPANIPAQLVGYLDCYSDAVGAVRNGNANAAKETAGGVAVAPLLSTQWGQDEPYNLLCPSYTQWSTGQTCHYPTGCVATAMAQIMKYHNYPPKGNGVVEWNSETLDLSKSAYDWNSMLDTYFNTDYTDQQAKAVATLMRDVGYAVRMMYSSDGSGAYAFDIAPAMIRNFNYSRDIRYCERSSFSTEEWTAMIRENLERGEPVIYGGAAINSAHQFVCDGIDSNDYLHINWGWYGSCDGYFDMNVLDPLGGYVGGQENVYFREQNMVVNIRPGDPDADNTSYNPVLLIYNWEFAASNASPGRAPLAVGMSFRMFTRRDAHGSYYHWNADLYDKDRNMVASDVSSSTYRYATSYYKYQDVEWTLNMTKAFEGRQLDDGDYFVKLRFRQGYNAEQDCEAEFACDSYFPLKVRDGSIVVEEVSLPAVNYELVSIVQNDAIYAGGLGSPTVDVTIRNTGSVVAEFGSLYMYCIPEAEAADDIDLSSYKSNGSVSVYAYAGSQVTVRGSIGKIAEPGRYRVYLADGDQKRIKEDLPQYIEITPLPDDRPFVLTSRVSTDVPSYENSDHEWMTVNVDYRLLPDGRWITENSVRMQVWAYPEGGGDADHFLLFEPADEFWFSWNADWYGNWAIKLSGAPDLLWRKPGVYNIYMKYEFGGQMVRIDDPNNSGSFLLKQEEVVGASAEMVSPMVINNGNAVVPGESFDVSFRIKSSTGINIDEEATYPRVVLDLSSWSSVCFCESLTFGKTELAPGEETDVMFRMYMPDDSEYYGHRMAVLLDLYIAGEEYASTLVNPGEFLESIYFDVTDPAGVDGVGVADGCSAIVTGRHLEIQGVESGAVIQLWSAAGLLIRDSVAVGSTHVEELDGVSGGIYIVRVTNSDGTVHVMKVLLR